MPGGYVQVNRWLKAIKGGSAFAINQYLGQNGTLWQKESFDYFVRYFVEGQYDRIRRYIFNNPIKAGLDKRYLAAPYRYEKQS